MKRRFTQVVIFLVALFFVAKAQVNTDSIFDSAINLAKDQQFNLALDAAKEALNLKANRGDILVFIANMYSLNDKNDSALVYINRANKIGYHKDDYYEVWTNILLQNRKYDDLLQACNEAESKNYPDKEDLFRKRLTAYTELKFNDRGISLIEEPQNKKYLEDKNIDDLYSYLILERNTSMITANYSLSMFDKEVAQHFGSLGYTFKIGESNMGFGANYTNRLGLNYLQVETKMNLRMGNDKYLYFNYAYAFKASLFPQHRGALEYYFTLPLQMVASLGGRYLYYQSLNTNVLFATIHLEKYFGKSWLSLRPFYVYSNPIQFESFSLIGNYRLFSKNEFNYWGLEVDYGNSPDDLYSTSQTGGFNQLTSYKIKLEKNFMLSRTSDFYIAVGYSNEKLNYVLYRNRYTLDLGYRIRVE